MHIGTDLHSSISHGFWGYEAMLDLFIQGEVWGPEMLKHTYVISLL